MKTLLLSVFAMIALAIGVAHADVSPTSVGGATTVSTEEAKKMFDAGVAFIDVRKISDWDAGRIPGAYHIELKKVFSAEELEKVVSKNQEVVIYCNGHSCMRSSKACEKAAGWGFTKVHYYRDGFPAWDAAGNPVE